MHIKKHKEHVIQRLNLKRNIVKKIHYFIGFRNFYKIGKKKKKRKKKNNPLSKKKRQKKKKRRMIHVKGFIGV